MFHIPVRKPSDLTFHDQFCGAGGNAEAAKLLGLRGVIAINHWPTAIESHWSNHPEIDHDCTDIRTCDPRRYAPADILLTSPECTCHSLAQGRKRNLKQEQYDLFSKKPPDPSQERSRATMGDVVRFATRHRYELVIVENVVDVKRWFLYRDWLKEMHKLGYVHKEVFLNAMFCHPTPQSRDRIYIVFWKKGNPEPNLEIRPRAFCMNCATDVEAVQAWRTWTKLGSQKWGRYGRQYDYVCPGCTEIVHPYHFAALNIIDWSVPAEQIGRRRRPLAKKTLQRVRYGLRRFGRQPLVVTNRYTSGVECRVRQAAVEALPTQPGDPSHALLSPFVVQLSHTHAGDRRAHDAGSALGTQTTRNTKALCTPPLFVTTNFFDSRGARRADEPFPTQTTAGKWALVAPAFLSKQYGGDHPPISLHAPAGTVTGSDHHALVELPAPFMTELHGTGRARSLTEPLLCVTAGGRHHGLVAPQALAGFLAHYYSQGGQASSLAESARTVTTRDRAAVVLAPSGEASDEDVERWIDQVLPECTFRMLKPHELKRAQAFRDDYVVLGNQDDQVKQIGQANPPPTMRTLLERGIATLL